MDTSHIDLVALIGTNTPLKQVARTKGGEFAGPCPFCGEGDDRFRVWPTPPDGKPHYWCRQCRRRGDAIQYLMDRDGRSFQSACTLLGLGGYRSSAQPHTSLRPVALPASRTERNDWDALSDPEWQYSAELFVTRCAETMNGPQGTQGREYCHSRGLPDEIIAAYQLGYNPAEHYKTWGQRKVLLPKGIVICF